MVYSSVHVYFSNPLLWQDVILSIVVLTDVGIFILFCIFRSIIILCSYRHLTTEYTKPRHQYYTQFSDYYILVLLAGNANNGNANNYGNNAYLWSSSSNNSNNAWNRNLNNGNANVNRNNNNRNNLFSVRCKK